MEMFTFYLTSIIILTSILMVVISANAVHSLLYLILSSLAMAVIFFQMGAPFAAALEVIVYAGAIMVLFVFVVMMLNLGQAAVEEERTLMPLGIWRGPALLAALLLAELAFLLFQQPVASLPVAVYAKQVGITLFGPYLLAVELASILLMAGLVGAYHLGRPLLKKSATRTHVRES
ncbi:NADH dehydrogenase I, subunit J [gamma proteobacterium HdN1]|nr:NADH dehydrogenase I, subunit J [gamma proteobacterium HdN1]